MLFSIIGTLFIGMGIILIGANNWWFSLPVQMRTTIAFLPLVASLVLLFYVYQYKMHSTAFLEGAAILNMAGVFSTIALIGQIFHIPGDFTNYILTCGVLSLPSMLAMNATAPLIIYYWTVINGGLYANEKWGPVIAVALFAIGAVYAVYHFRSENTKAMYMSWITAIAGIVVMFTATAWWDSDTFLLMFAFFALMLSASPIWEKAGLPMKITGTSGALVLLAVITYKGWWEHNADLGGVASATVAVLLTVASAVICIRNFAIGKREPLVITVLLGVVLRWIWLIAHLNTAPYDLIFMIISNIIMFATGVYYIWDGAKNVNLISANIGMVTVCTLIVMRFFDSELPLYARGVAFLLLGAGFLLLNLRLIGIKKKATKEVTV